MFCNKCGNQLNENEKVCPNCGNVVEEAQPQPNADFTAGQPQNTTFTPQQPQGVPYTQQAQAPKKKVDVFGLLPIISNAIGIVSGILSVIFGIKAENYFTLFLRYTSSESYGGDAYTGIQNAAADTGNNVRAVFELIQNCTTFLLIVIGLIAIAAFSTKLFNAIKEYKNNK